MARIDPLSVAMGKAVRAAIIESEATNTTVAKSVGLSWQSFSRRVNGHLPFTWPELFRIATATGTSVTEIIERAERIAERDAA